MDKNHPLAVLLSGVLFLLIVFGTAIALAGCSTLEPDAVRVYVEHESHALQHQPFTSNPTNYGDQSVNLELHWQKGPAFLDLSEGYTFNGDQMCDYRVCGGRETFKARVGVDIWNK